MKMVKVLIGLSFVIIMDSIANAAWISYRGNQGVIVVQQTVTAQPVARQHQSIHSHKAPQPLESSEVKVKLVKLVDNTKILPGGTITYTICANNQGTNTITDISFIDAIPSYTTFEDAGGTGTITYCHDGRGIEFDNNKKIQPITHVRWTLGSISPSGTATFVLKVRVK